MPPLSEGGASFRTPQGADLGLAGLARAVHVAYRLACICRDHRETISSMSATGGFRVFVSAVSKELGSQRHEVARVLRRKELEVREQEHFRQGGATLLEALRDYIACCDAVVLLVGERCGAFPSEEHAATLGSVAELERYCAASGQARASYTQWELLLAKHYGKKTYVFLGLVKLALQFPAVIDGVTATIARSS